MTHFLQEACPDSQAGLEVLFRPPQPPNFLFSWLSWVVPPTHRIGMWPQLQG